MTWTDLHEGMLLCHTLMVPASVEDVSSSLSSQEFQHHEPPDTFVDSSPDRRTDSSGADMSWVNYLFLTQAVDADKHISFIAKLSLTFFHVYLNKNGSAIGWSPLINSRMCHENDLDWAQTSRLLNPDSWSYGPSETQCQICPPYSGLAWKAVNNVATQTWRIRRGYGSDFTTDSHLLS